MARQAVIRRKTHIEMHGGAGSKLRDFILGWQDGLVNVLGVILGVAAATNSFHVIIIAAFAAALAESISMAAVAYTSFKAEADYYKSEVNREKREIDETPKEEEKEVRDIYKELGFKGSLLEKIIKHITANKKRWVDVMMAHELKIAPPSESPTITALVVGFSALVGSFIPVVPFFLFPVKAAIVPTLTISSIVLFFVGFYKAKTTVGNPVKSGLEMMAIGMLAALAGYAVGTVLGATVTG